MGLTGYKAGNHPQQTGRRGARDDIDDRGTDPALFAELDARFHFTLDVAASRLNKKCERYASSLPAPTTPTHGETCSDERRVLNPAFVEWLMGWPIGWTDCTRSATASYRSWLRSHSSSLRTLLDSWRRDG